MGDKYTLRCVPILSIADREENMVPLDTQQMDIQEDSEQESAEICDEMDDVPNDVPESFEPGDAISELPDVPDDVPEAPDSWNTVYPWGSREAFPSPEGEPRAVPFPERESPPVEGRNRRGIETG